jgi:hypothetical protein
LPLPDRMHDLLVAPAGTAHVTPSSTRLGRPVCCLITVRRRSRAAVLSAADQQPAGRGELLHGGEGVDDRAALALRAAQRPEEAIIAFQDAVTIYQETGDEYRHGIALSGSANGHGAIAPFGPLQVNDAHQHRSQ